MKNKRVCVVVLGDIGRSPRMQYHAMSISKQGYNVDIVGYGGSAPHSDLVFDHKISLHFMTEFPNFFSAIFPRIILYFLKVLWQSIILFVKLLWISRPDFILVQNPPSIPTLPVCWFISKILGIPLVIDWHNYGYSILSLALGSKHLLVRMSCLIERISGRMSHLNFCVTKAMSADLQKNWGINAVTLYDRPAEMFKPISLADKHELFLKLSHIHSEFSSSRPDDTLLTERFADGKVRLREDRPGLLVSSTSWTEDEDFSILLAALDEYELNRQVKNSEYPNLLCVITGKGPLKQHYLELIKSKEWQHIQVVTPWLEPEDYPKLIASADLGVCLHTSSSGLDLPMKVVDMFGCGLPVCAIGYNCLEELIRHDQNGRIFHFSEELADQLLDWFRGYPANEFRRSEFRTQLQSFQERRWHTAWVETAWPHLAEL